ncbi:MAG: sigma-70 family RNA polymerase sigma factor [Planctomycetota bacterium]
MDPLDVNERFLQGGDAALFNTFVEQHWPLVISVCRAQLHDEHEAEDAAQETFLKLARHRESIRGNVVAWLTTTARTTSIDRLRRLIRERRRREQWTYSAARAAATPDTQVVAHAARAHLPEALLELDTDAAELLIQRYVHHKPLRVIAKDVKPWGVSIATLSRRAAEAVEQLAIVLEGMGVFGAGDLPLAAYLADLRGPDSGGFAEAYTGDAGLVQSVSFPGREATPFPGWTRPMRLGVSLSHQNHARLSRMGFQTPLSYQTRATWWIDHPGVDLVGLIEPGTLDYAETEATLREYEIHAGLIDITNAAGLRTLDVIIVPNRLIYNRRFLQPIIAAVEAGVGVFREGHFASHDDPHDPDLSRFHLAHPPLEQHCTGGVYGSLVGHGVPVAAHVVNRHPAMPWLVPGQPLTVGSCGAVFRPTEDATTIIVRDEPIQGRNMGFPPLLPPTHAPAVHAGQLGRGRVVMCNASNADSVFGGPKRREERFLQTLAWLAEPRRERIV